MDTENTTISAEEAELIEYMTSVAGEKSANRLVKPGDVISAPDSPTPAMVSDPETLLGQPESAGYVVVFNKKTGKPVRVNKNNLTSQMRKTKCVISCKAKKCTHDRVRVFTFTDPGFRPEAPSIACFLAESDSDRALWDSYGFAVCNTMLRTELDKIRHGQRRHATEWAVREQRKGELERSKYEDERREDREFQRALLEKLVGDNKKGK